MNVPLWAWYAAGYGFALLFGHVFGLGAARTYGPRPAKIKPKKARESAPAPLKRRVRHGLALGSLERLLYVTALALGFPGFAALWLAVRVYCAPEREDKSPSRRLAFLIETALSLVFAAAGWLVLKAGSEGNYTVAGAAAALSLAAGFFRSRRGQAAGRGIGEGRSGKSLAVPAALYCRTLPLRGTLSAS